MAYLPDILSRAHDGGNWANCDFPIEVSRGRIRGVSDVKVTAEVVKADAVDSGNVYVNMTLLIISGSANELDPR